jgi:N-acetylneuraminate synthase/N,N'-diacetyllegionaminate synthase
VSASFATSFAIAGRPVGAGAPCYIIAEAGVAHFGNLDKARKLVDLAKRANADCVKFQHFNAERMIGASAPEWRARMKNRQLSDVQMAALASYARDQGMVFICTGHDEAALDFLDREIKVPAFKVGSGEVENWPYIANVARRGKPIILSTGLYTLDLIRRAIEVVAENGGRELAILHCVTSYPADPATINLDAMRQIREFFSGPVGYSDHTAGTAVPLAAVALGAQVLEKHITLDFNVPDAQDWKVSCGPDDFPEFVADARAIEAARGGGSRQLSAAEKESLTWARKSLHAARDIAAGAVVEADMLTSQRPGDGLPPSRICEVVGKRARRAIQAGTKLDLDMIEGK